MKTFLLIDLLQRKVNSLLFRFTLVIYSIAILTVENNYFNFWTYFTAILIYVSLYLYCINKSFIRLLNDFALITVVTIYKNPELYYIFIYLMLPIINSVNFSGNKKRPELLYLLSIIIFVILYFLFNERLDYKLMLLILPVLGLKAINHYTHLRVKIQAYKDDLIEVVDSFYTTKQNLQRPHKIYKELIVTINNIFKDRIVENIYCFTIVKDRIIVVNGTNFIWNFTFTSKDLVARIREEKQIFGEEVLIEERQVNLSLLMHTQLGDNEYFYLFTLNKRIPLYYSIIGFLGFIQPVLNKISNILLSEKIVQQIRYDEITTLSEKRQYVNRANNMMHFIRNRLSPFANLTAMLETLPKVNQNILDDYKKKLNEQNNRAKIELKNITDRADDMLEKSKNPFFYSILEDISIVRAYTIFKRSFTNIFPDEEIIADIEPQKSKFIIKLNIEGYEIFISDWLNNIKKYYIKYIKCTFTEDEEYLYIIFENDHAQSKEEITNLIKDLVSNDKNEILKRTTHGLYTIKSLLNEMNIDYDVKEEGKNLMLTLKFKIYEYESSNI
ncbi:hypothetical protein GR160_18550 [Flavobacterium sp. Sd200]|uniref:hypothetical protein n=1 Tax=Flavobacterium sp. Sd200 TaxID=2692211 RepID=UPI001372073D|nr:hypothetical protein [Flavobacterium sp. Sd200]MXN93234.1 hypothetical protein [Flavobacterium sp. Sd200]